MIWIGNPECIDVRSGAQRMRKPWASFPFLNDQLHAHRLGNHQDVGEDDACIDVDNVDWLNGNFCGEFRGLAEREEIMLRTHGAILREISPSLTHHPNRSPLDRLSPASSKKQIVCHRSTFRTTSGITGQRIGPTLRSATQLSPPEL